ncbi:acyl dehydratase [Pullulanibacillus pueri]|uniref:FAS1-like dehydratase domain-containing protein n=1 Tax=Pullulanibacillus pueri TaxID=1437324 RepID=A0A8J2ZWI8_9BACL|nr:MaoC family dehydratase N-terminal domain-containing protein [Pullulanibacillus pueri]MBM7682580.1 acyl dehydratase [Pullulanibacillus pueri]GGH82381.1 hypothetical protein GCM10007096_21680 [Pullulanibacillus pueri]
MVKRTIGKRSERVCNVVERGAVKRFAEAIGDPHPLYIEKDYGKHSRYKKNIAPPTFPRVFDYGKIEGLDLPKAGLIHGEQQFTYTRPLMVGESLYCYCEVESYEEKQARSGILGFLTIKYIGETASGQEVFTAKSVIILSEAVRRGR